MKFCLCLWIKSQESLTNWTVSHLQVVGNYLKSDGMDCKGGNREGGLRLSLFLLLIIFSCVLFLFLGVLIPFCSLFSLFLGAMGRKGVSGRSH